MIKVILVLFLLLTGCNSKTKIEDIINVQVSDNEILVDGIQINSESENVYVANDIIYYEEGKDFTYGEGTKEDEHSIEEASNHQVIHITKAGTYQISGKLSYGQIAIDLGSDAKDDPKAVVTLILNGLDINCEVAPAIIFYNVYECGDTDKASKDVDTSKAGANVIIKDNTINNVNGSYVAKIYKEDSVVLNDTKTEVEDAKKLHKYDGAFYSKMSMNIDGEKENNGILNINAKNEGLDSELHLTINGGIININSGNDGINTNEDGISVTTINNGQLNIKVTGETGEGDGIDSNGWLVINGGSVIAQACSFSGDAGIDSDMGIHINGGSVIATGSMLDRIEEGSQTYAVFNFAQKMNNNQLVLKMNDEAIISLDQFNDYSILVYSNSELKEGTYTLWCDDIQLEGSTDMMMGGRPNMPGGMQPPVGQEPPKDGFGGKNPNDGERPDFDQKPDGNGEPFNQNNQNNGQPFNPNNLDLVKEFNIKKGSNMFSNLQTIK